MRRAGVPRTVPQRKTIMVVDDAEVIRTYLKNLLPMKGYDILLAEDGLKAMELLNGGARPDVVVLDVMMPGMSGWEVCRKIREAVSLAHTGVVMLTGIGENLNEMTSPLYGADAYIDKPFEFEKLEKVIGGLVG
jgi:CheY-like chemotaxis protein